MLREIVEDLSNELLHKLVYKDPTGNENILNIFKNGEVTLSTRKGLSKSLSNLAFNINPDDFSKAGYRNSGTRDRSLWVKNSVKNAMKKSRGNSKKFADELGKLLKISGKFSVFK